jgi:hypothetical protein
LKFSISPPFVKGMIIQRDDTIGQGEKFLTFRAFLI